MQARVTALDSGESETISAAYLIGCDGFDGLVRKTLNTEYEGSGLLSYSLSIFFRSKSLGELHDKGWARFYRLVDGSSPSTAASYGASRFFNSIPIPMRIPSKSRAH